ncbi:carbohydrate-binding module family 13 protein [Rhizophagus irregularis DAOM 181602=DAOM 197198]|nr:carbohydrate-binding module family 13 protein [Rhizophagus irregularis DAOM 181602=DAOM 197198]
MLRYIYGGRLSLAEHDTSDVIKILIAASELNLYELIPHLQSFLIVNKTSWLEQNFCSIYQTSFENNSLSKLQNFCTELISNHPEKIFNLPDFTSISEKALISLIQHDNLRMSEVQVWEYVLKWGIAQNSELSSDPSSYSNDDFNALKNTLQQFIPLIKFTEFTSKEFLNKVYDPYKKIIPDETNEYLIKYFLNRDYIPNRNSEQNETRDIDLKNIDSNIITIQHAELISKWIDRLDITNELKNSYEFKLILRGSRDGFTPEKFHENCDSRSCTITVIKVEGSEEILGGFNPIEWKSDDSYGNTKDSFIFSFKNNDIDDYILSRVKEENKALFHNLNYGPSFGYGDLIIKSNYLFSSSKKDFNHCYCKKYSYVNAIRETGNGYTIKEYEIFQITKDTYTFSQKINK